MSRKDKDALRRKLLATRAVLGDDAASHTVDAATRCARRVAEGIVPQWRSRVGESTDPVVTLAAYAPDVGEPGWCVDESGAAKPGVFVQALRSAFWEAGVKVTVVLPRVLPGRLMAWHVYERMEDLAPGAFGLLEPRECLPTVDVTDIDIFVVPALACTATGERLGRGAGFYDRALGAAGVGTGVQTPARRSARPLVAALVHDHEVVDTVFAEPHDAPVDLVLTSGLGGNHMAAR